MVIDAAALQVLDARRAPFVAGLLGLSFTFLVGCDFADLEKGKPCVATEYPDAAGHVSCGQTSDCAAGYSCVDQVCQPDDDEADPSTGDAGVDAGDAGDADDSGDGQHIPDDAGDGQQVPDCAEGSGPDVCDAGEANPILTLGRHLAADGTNKRALASRIYATPIRTTDSVRLIELGVLTSSKSSGGFAMMAIYHDTVVNNLHRPGALIAYTFEAGLLSETANVIAPEDTTVVLEADTTYWLAVVQDGASVYYRQYAATPSSDGTGVYVEAAYSSWPAIFPATFPTPSYMSGFELSVFARVERTLQP